MLEEKHPVNVKVLVVMLLIIGALFVMAFMPQSLWVNLSMKYFH